MLAYDGFEGFPYIEASRYLYIWYLLNSCDCYPDLTPMPGAFSNVSLNSSNPMSLLLFDNCQVLPSALTLDVTEVCTIKTPEVFW